MSATLFDAIIEALPPEIREKLLSNPLTPMALNLTGADKILNQYTPLVSQALPRLIADLEVDGLIWQKIKSEQVLPFLIALAGRLGLPVQDVNGAHHAQLVRDN